MNLENREITIFFDDNKQTSKKIGKVTEITDFGVTINNTDLIPKHRIVRIQLNKQEENGEPKQVHTDKVE